MHDVIVVGAGPSGSFVAMKCAEAGLDVLLLDAEGFPRDKACGGVVGQRAVNLVGKDVLDVAEREGTGIDFFFNWRSIGHLDGHGYFFKRRKLDHYLVGRAVSAGAVMRERTRASGIGLTHESVIVHTDGGDLESQIVIGADGINSVVGRSLGLSHLDDTCRYASLRAEIDVSLHRARELGVEDPPRQATYFFSDLVGFAWIIPNMGSVNVGYGSTVSKARGLKGRLHAFLSSLGLEPQYERGAQIPFMPLTRIYADRVLLTGDAAGFVNPWTGSGIDEGIVASGKAAIVCKEAVNSCDFSAAKLSDYQMLCRDQLKEINWRGRWVKALDRIVPEDYEFPFWVRFLIRRLATLA